MEEGYYLSMLYRRVVICFNFFCSRCVCLELEFYEFADREMEDCAGKGRRQWILETISYYHAF